MAKDKTGNGDKINYSARLLSGILIILTLVLSVCCIMALAATLTQTRISGISIEGVSLNIWKLDTLRRQWLETRQEISRQREQLVAAERRATALNTRRTTAEEKYNEVLSPLLQLQEQFTLQIPANDPLSAQLAQNPGPIEHYARVLGARDRFRDNSGLNELIERITAAYALFQVAYIERKAIQAAQESVAKELEDLRKTVKKSQESLDPIFAAVKNNLDESSRSRIETALYELYPTTGRVSKVMNMLVLTQPDVLTLTLVILMGVLGSTLQITHSFFKEWRAEQFGVYFLRIALGAVTALIIFIVAKAGVPIIADASKLGGDAPINPYFVSFLAIISGLLSENAVVSVQAYGARFFGPSSTDEPARWARSDLTTAIKDQHLAIDTIAVYLSTTASTAEAILQGQEKADATQQKIISIFLREDPRDLFTDIPPRGVPSTEPPAPERSSGTTQP
jgi:hypothetical protein